MRPHDVPRLLAAADMLKVSGSFSVPELTPEHLMACCVRRPIIFQEAQKALDMKGDNLWGRPE